MLRYISWSLSINDFKANPYCLLSLSASSSDIPSTNSISFLIVSPPSGIVFVYTNLLPSKTPISMFPAPISNSIMLSFNSFLSNTRFLSARVIGTIPSNSTPAFFKIEFIFFIYSLSTNIICACIVKLELRQPTGSCTSSPLSNIKLSVTISIIALPSGISISLICIILVLTSFTDIPAYLSFTSFIILF